MEEGKNIITAEYERGSIKDFEKRVLAEGRCKAFLPTSFVTTCEKERASFDCSGYHRTIDPGFKDGGEMMNFLEKCVFAMIESCGHLLNPKKMRLSGDTVFFRIGGKDVRFAFMPRNIPADSANVAFIEFLEELKTRVGDRELCGYLEAVASYIRTGNCSLFDVITYIGELKQEIHACG